MKSIFNTTYFIGGENADNTRIIKDDEQAPKGAAKITTADLIKTAINNVPQTGLTPDEMFKRLQALNSLHEQKEKPELDFENEHFETIHKCVLDLKFSMLEASFYHFIDQIKLANGK